MQYRRGPGKLPLLTDNVIGMEKRIRHCNFGDMAMGISKRGKNERKKLKFFFEKYKPHYMPW